jgi:hypothetical protein|tara:strand:- start:155 stop:535 length:381 start_codon:yes stop_codon:yes gene_type:complete
MLKAFLVSGVAASAAAALASPALAGPYLNVENNSGWSGSQFVGAATDFHAGYEGQLGDSASWYVQGGATYVTPDGADSDTVPSGKAGMSLAATQSINMYGELSFVGSGDDDIDRSYGGKLGVKYSF